jgi:hypothetical protein
LAVPDATQAEESHRVITAEAHLAGSPADRRTAEFMLRRCLCQVWRKRLTQVTSKRHADSCNR